MSVQTARDAKVIVDGLVGSKALGRLERLWAIQMQRRLEAVLEADRLDVLLMPKAFFVQAVGFLFLVSKRHPGTVPPPFPEVEHDPTGAF